MCAGCHEFNFPEDGAHWNNYDSSDRLQATVSEWASSRAAARGETCVDCHFPSSTDGERTHAIRDTRDPLFMRGSVRVQASARPTSEGTVLDLQLRAARVGHRVPTGDMFRRLRITARSETGTTASAWLGRRFARMPNAAETGFAMRPVLDERLAPADSSAPGKAQNVRLVLPPGAELIRWSVDYYRLPPEAAQARGLEEAMIRVPLREGTAKMAALQP